MEHIIRRTIEEVGVCIICSKKADIIIGKVTPVFCCFKCLEKYLICKESN